jgi:hypothetical protein
MPIPWQAFATNSSGALIGTRPLATFLPLTLSTIFSGKDYRHRALEKSIK